MCWLLTILKEGKYKTKSKMFLLLPCSSSRAFSECVSHPFLQPGTFFMQLLIQPSPFHLSRSYFPDRPSRINPPTVTASAFSHLNPLPAFSISQHFLLPTGVPAWVPVIQSRPGKSDSLNSIWIYTTYELGVLSKWFLKFLSLHNFISNMRMITIMMINSCLVVLL